MALPEAPGAGGAGFQEPPLARGCAGHAGRGHRGTGESQPSSRRNTPVGRRRTIRIARRTVSQNREEKETRTTTAECGRVRGSRVATCFVWFSPSRSFSSRAIERVDRVRRSTSPIHRLPNRRPHPPTPSSSSPPPARGFPSRSPIPTDAPPRSIPTPTENHPGVASRGFPESRIAARGSHASHARVSRGLHVVGLVVVVPPAEPTPPLDPEPVDPLPSTRFGGGERAKRLEPDEDDDGGRGSRPETGVLYLLGSGLDRRASTRSPPVYARRNHPARGAWRSSSARV